MKIATRVASRAVRPVISASAVAEQAGLVSGRNFVDSLQELDTELRVLAALAGDLPRLERITLLMSSETRAAFPSVSQQWLERALEATDPHKEVERFVASLYSGADALCHRGEHGEDVPPGRRRRAGVPGQRLALRHLFRRARPLARPNRCGQWRAPRLRRRRCHGVCGHRGCRLVRAPRLSGCLGHRVAHAPYQDSPRPRRRGRSLRGYLCANAHSCLADAARLLAEVAVALSAQVLGFILAPHASGAPCWLQRRSRCQGRRSRAETMQLYGRVPRDVSGPRFSPLAFRTLRASAVSRRAARRSWSACSLGHRRLSQCRRCGSSAMDGLALAALAVSQQGVTKGKCAGR